MLILTSISYERYIKYNGKVYGHIIDPAYDKDRQTVTLCAFNDKVAQDPRLEKVILPLRDGLTIIRVKS